MKESTALQLQKATLKERIDQLKKENRSLHARIKALNVVIEAIEKKIAEKTE